MDVVEAVVESLALPVVRLGSVVAVSCPGDVTVRGPILQERFLLETSKTAVQMKVFPLSKSVTFFVRADPCC